MTDTEQPDGVNTVDAHLQLVQQVLQGDPLARRRLNTLAHPIITGQTERFCKRYCYDSRYHFACTLLKPWGSAPASAPLCEWGNGSYAWMLDDLTGDANLRRYEGRGGANLKHYFYFIVNSLPFYERWKDWRFGRRVHVPEYIKDMAPMAAKVFLAMAGDEPVPSIAQRLGADSGEVQALADRIMVELVKRKRLHLLTPPKTLSLSLWEDADDTSPRQADMAYTDPDPVAMDQQHQLQLAWQQLTAVEQFVLEATLIEKQDVEVVLSALRKLDQSIAKGVPAAKTDRQQLYYFRRKSLAKLARLMGVQD